MSQELDIPYVPIITHDLEFGTAEKNVNYFTGHVVFFLFNVINVVWILVFEGYVFRTLAKSFLLKLVLCGCFLQALSCITSLIRYNINDEFGGWAVAGVWTSNPAFACINAAVSEVFFVGSRRRVLWWHLVAGFWFVITTASSIYSHVMWDEIQFEVFRQTVPVSSIYQIAAMSYCLARINNGTLTSSLGNEMAGRLLTVLIAINATSFLLKLNAPITGDVIPLLTYPNTGWYFTTCLIFVKYFGAGQLESTAAEETGTAAGEETTLL